MKEKTEKVNKNNIWNKEDFAMAGIGERNKLFAKLKHFFRCIKWSGQRVFRGYADCDIWSIDCYLQRLIPDMLQTLKDTRHGSPGHLGENYTNEDGILVNDTCHTEWDRILERMIFLWRESDNDNCSRKNPYEDEMDCAFRNFADKYGMLGEKLQTEEELNKNRENGNTVMHFMDEVPEYKDIYDRYFAEEKELENYRSACKDEAIDMLKEYFYDLWD